jgi:Domain of unknown function (DUF892)
LGEIITNLGGTPTKEKAGLPILNSPEPILNTMKNAMTLAEIELKESEQDTIIENAEVTGYNMLIQWAIKLNIAANAIPLLRQNLREEEKMFGWLRANVPAMFAKLWPRIERESSFLTSTSPSSPPIMQDQQQQDEKFKGGSTTRHGSHLTVTTEAVSDKGNIAADTVVEGKGDQKKHKTTKEER